jgi:hypothetical protein
VPNFVPHLSLERSIPRVQRPNKRLPPRHTWLLAAYKAAPMRVLWDDFDGRRLKFPGAFAEKAGAPTKARPGNPTSFLSGRGRKRTSTKSIQDGLGGIGPTRELLSGVWHQIVWFDLLPR